ncbi:MAG: hypothetical protein ACRD4V_15280, partial [Candidatus Acidiferrales bacterium]
MRHNQSASRLFLIRILAILLFSVFAAPLSPAQSAGGDLASNASRQDTALVHLKARRAVPKAAKLAGASAPEVSRKVRNSARAANSGQSSAQKSSRPNLSVLDPIVETAIQNGEIPGGVLLV